MEENTKTYYSINSLLDPSEDCSFSLLDNITKENKATLVIKDRMANIYFEDDHCEEFGDNINKMIERVDELGLKFIKLSEGNNRWFEYNPNPQNNNIGDCTLRAYCAAFDISWEEAFDIAAKYAKDNALLIENVFDKVLTEHFGCTVDEKYNKKSVKSADRITISEFAMTHPRHTYLVHTRGHVVTIKDGMYYDSWDSGKKKIDTVYNP